MSDELIVLPKAVVERVIARFRAEEKLGGCTQRGMGFAAAMGSAAEDLEDLLADAKPAVDEAVTHAVTFSSRPDAQCFVETQSLWEVSARGTYRILLIAADDAEEG